MTLSDTSKTYFGDRVAQRTMPLPPGRVLRESEYYTQRGIQEAQDLALHAGLQAVVNCLVINRKALTEKIKANNYMPIDLLTWRIPDYLLQEMNSQENIGRLQIALSDNQLGLVIQNSSDRTFYRPAHMLKISASEIPESRLFTIPKRPFTIAVFDSTQVLGSSDLKSTKAEIPLQGVLYGLNLSKIDPEQVTRRISDIVERDITSLAEDALPPEPDESSRSRRERDEYYRRSERNRLRVGKVMYDSLDTLVSMIVNNRDELMSHLVQNDILAGTWLYLPAIKNELGGDGYGRIYMTLRDGKIGIRIQDDPDQVVYIIKHLVREEFLKLLEKGTPPSHIIDVNRIQYAFERPENQPSARSFHHAMYLLNGEQIDNGVISTAITTALMRSLD